MSIQLNEVIEYLEYEVLGEKLTKCDRYLVELTHMYIINKINNNTRKNFSDSMLCDNSLLRDENPLLSSLPFDHPLRKISRGER